MSIFWQNKSCFSLLMSALFAIFVFMIEVITDIKSVLEHYMAECKKKTSEVNDLRKTVSEKEEEIRELKDQLARFKGPIPNSSNSNTPPSQNPIQVKINYPEASLEVLVNVVCFFFMTIRVYT